MAESGSGKVSNTIAFTTSAAAQKANFGRVLPFGGRIATWDDSTLFVLNVADVQVNAEYAQFGVLLAAAASDAELFLVGGGGRVVVRVQSMSPRDYVVAMANGPDWQLALEAALTHRVLVPATLRALQGRLPPDAREATALMTLLSEAEAAEEEQRRKEREAAAKKQEEEETKRRKTEEERIAVRRGREGGRER